MLHPTHSLTKASLFVLG